MSPKKDPGIMVLSCHSSLNCMYIQMEFGNKPNSANGPSQYDPITRS